MTSVLEGQLTELAARLDVETGARLVADVLSRLDDGAPAAGTLRRGPRVWLAAAAAVVVVVLAATLLVPQSRDAVARFLGIGSTRIEPGPVTVTTASDRSAPSESSGSSMSVALPTTTSPVNTATFPAELHLGSAVDAATAAERTGLPVPVAPALEPRSGIFADTAGEFAQVIVVYPPSDALPASPVAGVGALLSTTSGYVSPTYFLKFVDPGTTVDAVDVPTAAGDVVTGIWLGGTSHVYVIDREGDGALTTDELRLATNTLLWQVDGAVYRFESALDRDGALAVAATVIDGTSSGDAVSGES